MPMPHNITNQPSDTVHGVAQLDTASSRVAVQRENNRHADWRLLTELRLYRGYACLTLSPVAEGHSDPHVVRSTTVTIAIRKGT